MSRRRLPAEWSNCGGDCLLLGEVRLLGTQRHDRLTKQALYQWASSKPSLRRGSVQYLLVPK
jgi:hypothetical protein